MKHYVLGTAKGQRSEVTTRHSGRVFIPGWKCIINSAPVPYGVDEADAVAAGTAASGVGVNVGDVLAEVDRSGVGVSVTSGVDALPDAVGSGDSDTIGVGESIAVVVGSGVPAESM